MQHPRQDYDDEDEEDFNPEDESTPLHMNKTWAGSTKSTEPSSNPRKRKLSATQVPYSQAPRSSPPVMSHGSIDAQETVPATKSASGNESASEEEADMSPQEDSQASSQAAERATPEPLSETMAPPQSSSTSSSPNLPRAVSQQVVARGRNTTRGRAPLHLNQDSPPSSPPSLTHSPNRAIARSTLRRGKRQPAQPATFSTAQLQDLLPRRRRRAARNMFDIASSDEEVDVSGLASDDDELTHLTVRTQTRRRGTLFSRTPAPLKKTVMSGTGAQTKPGKGAKRTYGSNILPTSDKENEAIDPDDSLGPLPDNESPEQSQELEERVGKELKKAARKFQEVDKWELDFEIVTASSSSPRDAR